MAYTNQLNQNPMEIGAVMTTSYKASVAATLGTLLTLQIEKLYWEGAVNTGDYLRIIDPMTGNLLIEIYSVAGGSSYTMDWTAKPKIWADFRVSQIDSGKLFLYTK